MEKIIEIGYEPQNFKKMDKDYMKIFFLLDKKTDFVSEKVTSAMYKENNRFLTRTERKEACFSIEGSNPITRFFLTLKNGLTREIILEMNETKYLDSKFKKKARSICGMLKNAI